MIRTAMVGLGKMGLSHLSILRAHPEVELVVGCDSTTYLTDALSRYANLKCVNDYDKLLSQFDLDAILIATPSKFHASMVEKALSKGLHVFCEKPFVLDTVAGEKLVRLAAEKNLITQVGYHYRFVGAFQEAARIVQSGVLGKIHHIRAEAYGPVVLRPKGSTWRTSKNDGGGALYDYACHAVDLIHYIHAVPNEVSGVVRQPVFSRDVDDEVYCTMRFPDGSSGQLSVNWSDESFRKMSTKISVWGTNGRLTADRQECQVYLREPNPDIPEYGKGWTVRYTTDLTRDVWFYLRGEEYSAQIDHFFQRIKQRKIAGVNDFGSALNADKVVSMILQDEDQDHLPSPRTVDTSKRHTQRTWKKWFVR